jgi:amino acid transporter
VCVVFAIGVSYIAYRGVNGSTGVNIAMNIIQIAALLVFSFMAVGYRMSHKEGAAAIHLSGGTAVDYQVDSSNVTAADDKGVQQPVPDSWANGDPKYQSSANVTADNLDPAKDTDADLLAYIKANTLKVGDILPDFQKDSAGKYVKDAKGNIQPILAIKQQDRTVTDDDLNAASKDPGVIAALPTLKSMGLNTGDPYPVFNKDKDGKITGPAPFTISYTLEGGGMSGSGTDRDPTTYNYAPNAAYVVAPHGFSNIIVQACIAILCLVGFESVSSMGEEAKNAKRDIPKAILLSLVIQGAFCYLIEYFCANYFLNSGYTMPDAGASSAPIGDMMKIVGMWAFGSANAGVSFMYVQAVTVFLALIGTTLACLNTGARVTYAMGRDEEMGAHFGMLHEKTLSPHKAIWTLCWISIVIGIITCAIWDGGQGADLAPLDKHNIWYSFGIYSPHAYTYLPNTILIITLISNFGTFLLYMTTCIIAIVAFREHHTFHGFKHVVIPVFGVIANFICMLFYLIGPLPVNGSSLVAGMSWHEPYIALVVVAIWGIYGAIYFAASSKKKGREVFLTSKPATSA